MSKGIIQGRFVLDGDILSVLVGIAFTAHTIVSYHTLEKSPNTCTRTRETHTVYGKF